MPINDAQCKQCGPDADIHEIYTPIVAGTVEYPNCERCGQKMEFLVSVVPATDVLGCEVYDPVLDITYSSTRDRDRQMREANFMPAGDAVGGDKRNEISSWRERQPTFSYASQGRRG